MTETLAGGEHFWNENTEIFFATHTPASLTPRNMKTADGRQKKESIRGRFLGLAHFY